MRPTWSYAIFFVSGFLITKLLIAEYQTTKTISLKKFYFRRFLRLYPALILMLVITSIVILTYGYKLIIPEIMAGLFYYTNYYRIYFFVPLPAENYPSPGLLWSLAVEEHFYLVFPILFFLFFNWGKKNFLNILWALLILFLLLRVYTFNTTANVELMQRKIYMLTHCRADSILYGCVSAILLYKTNSSWYQNLLQTKQIFYISLVLLIGTQAFPNIFFRNTFKFSFQGIAFSLIIPTFLFYSNKNILLKALNNKPIVFIGRLSYSLYLFHWVALAFCNLYFSTRSITWYAIFILITVTLSLSSYLFVEKPFLRLRKKFGSNAV
ncbi:MAG: acyltransferase [Chitinophagaceae bacterium]|nr:acyltransferase [Chitinophagaceae bacterium]